MPSSGATKPEGATNFDGEEPTEVLAVPRAPQKTIEMRLPEPALKDEEGPDRTYLAPRSIPTQAVPDQGPEDNKIVINVKTPAPSDVESRAPDQPKLDAERARRRAPTVRIERGTLKAQGLLPAQPATDDIDVSFEGEVDAVEPPPQLSTRQDARRDKALGSGDWGGRDAATQVMAKRPEKGSSLKMVFIGILLIVALGGAGLFALGYLGVVSIPGVPLSEEAAPAPTATPTAKAAPTMTTPAQPTSAPTPAPPTAEPTQTQAAESVVPPTSSAPVRPTATTPRPVVKPRWVPPVSTKANPTTI